MYGDFYEIEILKPRMIVTIPADIKIQNGQIAGG